MSRAGWMIVVALLWWFPTTSVRAEQAEPPNAADVYRRAFEQYRAVSKSLTEDQWMQIYNFEVDPTGLLTPQIRASLEKFAPVIQQIHRAASMPVCDFGGEPAADPFATREHLRDMRGLAKLLRYDMHLRICDGDEAALIERTNAALRMGDQIAQDDPLISHLVGAACFALGNGLAREMADYGLLTPEGASQILPALDGHDPNDPFGYRVGIGNVEAETAWMIQQLSTDEGRMKLIEHADWFVGEDMMAQFQLAATSPEDWRIALDKCANLAKRISAVSDETDLEKMKAQMLAISDEIGRGEHGPLAEGLLGFCRNMPLQMEAVAKQFAETRGMLESVAQGKIDPKSLANAANLYLRAINMINAIDRERFETVRSLAAANPSTAPIDDATERCLIEAQPIIDLLREASLLDKCNFEIWGPLNRSHPGMRDAARLLHADAIRLLRDGQIDQFTDLLEITLRISGQLALQKDSVFSLIAQAVVNRSDKLIAVAIEGGKLNTDHLTRLSIALDALREGDPFGFDQAVSTSREQWRQMFGKDWTWSRNEDKNQDLIKRATESVNRCDGDDLLWYSMALEEAYKDSPTRASGGPSVYVAPLNDIIALEVFGPAMEQVQPIRSIIEDNDFDRLDDFESPVFAHIEQRRAEANADFQRIRRKLPKAEQVLGHPGEPATRPHLP